MFVYIHYYIMLCLKLISQYPAVPDLHWQSIEVL